MKFLGLAWGPELLHDHYGLLVVTCARLEKCIAIVLDRRAQKS